MMVADPVAFGAAVVAFVEIGAKLGKVLFQYCTEVANAPGEMAKLNEELQSITMIGLIMKEHLREIQETLSNREVEMFLRSRVKAWKQAMKQLEDFLSSMYAAGSRGSTFKNWRAITWPFKMATVRKQTARITDLKGDFILILQLKNDTVSSQISSVAKDIWTKVNTTSSLLENWRSEYMAASLESKRGDVYAWLKPATFDEETNLYNREYAEGSCNWILKTRPFQNWKGADENAEGKRFLWIHGDMGCGKTFLSLFIRSILSTSESPVIYFSFNKSRGLISSNLFLRTVLYVILGNLMRGTQDDVVERLYRARLTKGQPINLETDELQIEVKNILRGKEAVFIVDGFDECRDDDRGMIWETLTTSLRDREGKLLILTRQVPDGLGCKFDQYLPSWKPPYCSIRFSKSSAKCGVEQYIQKRLRLSKTLLQYEGRITQRATAAASGWFLFARLLIDDLEKEIYEDDLKTKTENLPVGLIATYKTHLDRIGNDERMLNLAKEVFAWLTISIEPMTLSCLTEALQVSKRLLDPITAIRDVGSPLCNVSTDTNTVQFIHASIMEYLTDEKKIKPEWMVLGRQAHKYAADRCRDALRRPESSKAHDLSGKRVSFFAYAAVNWSKHAKEYAGQNGREDCKRWKDDVLKSFEDERFFNLWTTTRAYFDYEFNNFFQSVPMEPLYIAMYDGFPWLMEAERASGSKKGLAMLVAAKRGPSVWNDYRRKIRSDKVPTDRFGRTPLFHASAEGHLDIVMDLKDDDAQNTADNDDTLPLVIAAVHGHQKIALTLMDSSHSLIKQGSLEELLQIASERGLIDLTKALLKKIFSEFHEVSKDIVDSLGEENNALQLAVSNRHIGIVEELLGAGATVGTDSRIRKYSALHFAVENGDFDMTKLLLGQIKSSGNRSDSGRPQWMDFEDQYKWNPFHKATKNGDSKIIELFVQQTPQDYLKQLIDAPTDWPLYPLGIAATEQNYEVIEMLLRLGAEVNSRNKNNETPLYNAASHGNSEIVQLLLRNGADPDIADRFQMTASEVAKHRGFTKVANIVQAWSEQNRKPCTCASDIYTQGIDACRSGQSDVLRRIETEQPGVFPQLVTHQDEHGNTLLHHTAFSGDNETVTFLLQKNVTNSANKLGDTPLHVAARKGYDGMVSALLELSDDNGSALNDVLETPLHLAAEFGHANVVNMLLKKMPEGTINALDKWHSTALYNAVENGHVSIVEALLREGATIHTRNQLQRSPLDEAKEKKYFHIWRALSARASMHCQIDKEIGDQWKNNQLHCAILTDVAKVDDLLERNRDREQVEWLLQGKNARDEIPLHTAVRERTAEVVRKILEAASKFSVDIKNARAHDLITPLHLASSSTAKECRTIVGVLLEYKCNVNCLNFWHWTPLHYAVQAGATEIAQELLDHRAAVDAVNDEGETPLHFAAKRVDTVFMDFLIRTWKARSDLVNRKGLTADDVLKNARRQQAFWEKLGESG